MRNISTMSAARSLIMTSGELISPVSPNSKCFLQKQWIKKLIAATVSSLEVFRRDPHSSILFDASHKGRKRAYHLRVLRIHVQLERLRALRRITFRSSKYIYTISIFREALLKKELRRTPQISVRAFKGDILSFGVSYRGNYLNPLDKGGSVFSSWSLPHPLLELGVALNRCLLLI